MKRTTFLLTLGIMLACASSLSAQTECIRDTQSGAPDPACCNDIICTDPTNNNAENNERSGMKNQFNWMSSTWNVFHPLPGGGYTSQNGTAPYSMQNPFKTDYPYLMHLNYSNVPIAQRTEDKLDFYPADGWELLYKNNGLKSDESTPVDIGDQRPGPLFVLYNKYQGKIRVFAGFADIGANDQIQTRLRLLDLPGLHASAIFNHNGELSSALDNSTSAFDISSGAEGTIGGYFFSTDFITGYDPCTCHFPSELEFEFRTQNTLDVTLEGRMIGTNVPLDGSGNSPLLNDKRDFLTAVNRKGFSIQGGMLTYANIDKLIQEYKDHNSSDLEIPLALLGEVLKTGAKAGDKWLEGPTGLVVNDIPFVGTVKNQGWNLLAKGATWLMGEITPDKKSIPSVSFIEAEMALSGTTIRDERKTGATSARIANPGSKHTENTEAPDFYPDINYPQYNEALGVFALLKTPVVKRYYNAVDPTYTGWGEREVLQFQIDPSSIKYAFNPAAEVDEEKTNISVSLEVNELHRNTPTWTGDGIELNGTQFSFARSAMNSTQREWYSTPAYPINYISSVTNKMYNVYYDPSQNNSRFFNDYWYQIKFEIAYVFKPNKYGKVIRFLKTATYPVFPENVSQPLQADGDNYPVVQEITTPTTYSTDQVIYAWGKINIQADVNTTNGAKVRFIAPYGVDVGQNVNLGSDITPEVGFPPVEVPIPPATKSEIKSFCTGNDYNAKHFDYTIKGIDYSRSNKDSIADNHLGGAHPNPAAASFAIPYTVASPGRVEMALFNSFGQNIGTIVDNPNHQKGRYEVRVDAAQFPAGVYFYTMRTGCFTQMGKVILVR